MSGEVRLTAELEAVGGNNAGFVVPDDVVAGLGGGGRPKVVVTVNGATFRTSVARMGGRYLLGLNAARRAEAGVAAGDVLEIAVVLDEAPRTVDVPADLDDVLAGDPALAQAWAGWSFTKQSAAATSLTSAKKPETRAARLVKVVDSLR